MKCERCGFDNPDYLEFCRNCSARLPQNNEASSKPSWGFVKAPQWTEPDFSADNVSEDDVPSDFVFDSDSIRKRHEAERKAAADAAAEKARRAAEAAAAAMASEKMSTSERRAAEEARAAERRAAEESRAAQRRAADEARAAERRAADEAHAAQRRAEQDRLLEQRKRSMYDDENDETSNQNPDYDYEEEENSDEDDYSGSKKSFSLAPLFGSFLKNRKKPSRDDDEDYEDDEEDDEEEYDDYDRSRKNKKPARVTIKKTSNGGGSDKMRLALKIASIVAVGCVLALILWLVISQISSCVASSKSPTGSNKAPTIEKNANEEDSYIVTVYAANGKVLIYETPDGRRREATVKKDNCIPFKVHTVSLMPVEPVDGTTYDATPKVFVKNEDGSETIVDNMPSVTLNVPAIAVTYDTPDTIVSENGHVTVSGHIDFIGTELTIDGEKVSINTDGSFSREVVYEETGAHTINIEGRLAGHQIYRHSIDVSVNKATPSTSLIQFPWDYGDTEFKQRVTSSTESITIRGKVPAGSTLTASCESSDVTLSTPSISDDGSFTVTASLKNPSDYVIHFVCTSSSDQVSERDMHVQRQPEMAQYIARALPMNYAAFSYETWQPYNVKGKVTEILQDGDFILAMLETEDGNKLVLEYHNHYGSAANITVGQTYENIYGRTRGLNADGLPQIYVWFIND